MFASEELHWSRFFQVTRCNWSVGGANLHAANVARFDLLVTSARTPGLNSNGVDI